MTIISGLQWCIPAYPSRSQSRNQRFDYRFLSTSPARTRNLLESSKNLGSADISGGSAKGAPAIECQTYTQLVSPAKGPKKRKNGGLNNSGPRSL